MSVYREGAGPNIYERFGPELRPEVERLRLFEPYAMQISLDAIGQLRPGQRLLDIACGPGTQMLRHYAMQGVECVAFDTNMDMLKLHEEAEDARRGVAKGDDRNQRVYPVKGNMRESVLGQLEELNIQPGTFDVIHIRAGTAYLTPTQEAQLLADAYHLLKDGGSYVDAEIYWDSVFDPRAGQANPHMRTLAGLAKRVEQQDLGFRANHGMNVLSAIERVWGPMAHREGKRVGYDAKHRNFPERTDDEWYRIIQLLRHPIAGGTARMSQDPKLPPAKREELERISWEAKRAFDQIDEDAKVMPRQRRPVGHPGFMAGIAVKNMLSRRPR